MNKTLRLDKIVVVVCKRALIWMNANFGVAGVVQSLEEIRSEETPET